MTDAGSGAGRLPLSALLSEVLVAFIIEFDNEFERQMPHRTSEHGRTQARGTVPWLVSMAMWSTCLRFVGEDGITVGELGRRARTGTNLAGMQRWGYITVAADPADTRPGPPRSGWVIHATASGRRAQKIWQPLASVIEERWTGRFGADDIAALKDSLQVVAGQLDPALPDCLPILGHGLWSTRTTNGRPRTTSGRPRTTSGRPGPPAAGDGHPRQARARRLRARPGRRPVAGGHADAEGS